MANVDFITHRNVTILKMDLSHLAHVDESIEIIKEAKGLVSRRPAGSVLILTDVTGTVFNAKWVDEIKRFSTFATPFIKASAVVGVTALSHVIYDAVIRSAGRNIASFDTEAEALDWLAAQ